MTDDDDQLTLFGAEIFSPARKFRARPAAPVLALVADNTSAARARRWRQQLLTHECPTCHAPAGQPCTMPAPVSCWPRNGATDYRLLHRSHHLTRADKTYRIQATK
jgi:hypothetical protein